MNQYSPIDLEDFVRRRAPEIAKDIREAASRSSNEADLVAEVEDVLKRFERNFDIRLHLERERTLINGRADAVYNRLVIEYEPPNSLRKSNAFNANKHAIEQVRNYMDDLERLDRHRKERLAGVVLDGNYYIFIRHRDGRWFIDDPLPVNSHSTETFLSYLLSLSTELALTPENLVRDFGENSNTARQVVPALYHSIRTTDNPKTHTIFNQWRLQFHEVSGYDPESGQLDARELARSYAVKLKQPDIEQLFFAIHTYYATFIKLLAVQVVNFYLMPKLGTDLAAAADYSSEKLKDYLKNMERGGLFKELGIRNFLEGDFFGWYLEIWDDQLDLSLRRLIGDLANYSLVTLDVDPEETRDLLKQLYQNLMPRKLRHALGEYYTPDWLAERLLNQLDYDGNPVKRILDPACGSGTFLVLAIKRVRKYADDKLLPPARVLEQLLENVVGFDLNPLAVISARTNYLLALGDLLQQRQGEITIPVYLCDSILTPNPGDDLFTHNAYSFNTSVGRFSVPKSLVDAQLIDRLADLLEECVNLEYDASQFRAYLMQELPLREPEDGHEITLAVALFNQLLELNQKGINGIWARIIKNAFAPLFQPKFDYVAGNPPWINWESLPEEYRKNTLPIWHYHGLIPPGGLRSIMGHSKMDLSALFTYVSIENYLKNEGKLGFIITQSVFKTSGAGQSFRRFTLGDGTSISVQFVDDMVEILPFEGASNRTAVMIIEKGQRIKYPVSYNHWSKSTIGKRISEDADLKEVIEICRIKHLFAEPVDENDRTSSWITAKRKALSALRKITGKSDYIAHAGAYSGGANAVYWLEIIEERNDDLIVISNITEGAKRKVDKVQSVIERDLVYPLLKSKNVKKWRTQMENMWFLIPRRVNHDEKAVPEEEMKMLYPKAYNYLTYFKESLADRRDAVLMRSGDSIPFYSIGAVNHYTFAPWKVVWPNMGSKLTAAVIGSHNGKPIIPQHIITLIAFENYVEAHYVCSVINSSPFYFCVQSFSQKGGKSFGTPGILEEVRVPIFEPNNKIHIRLSDLSQRAHNALSMGETAMINSIEEEIDHLASRLWGLTQKELLDIRESLAELG